MRLDLIQILCNNSETDDKYLSLIIDVVAHVGSVQNVQGQKFQMFRKDSLT